MLSQKRQNDLGFFPGQSIQHYSNPNLWPNHWCWRNWSWTLPWRPTRELTPKRMLFITEDWNAKVRSQKIPVVQASLPWSTKWSRVKANSFFRRIHWSQQTPSSNNSRDDYTHGDHLKINIKTRLIYSLQPKMIYSLQPNMEKLYRVSENKTGSWLKLRSWAPYCKIRLKLKKKGKTNRPFRCDLNVFLMII